MNKFMKFILKTMQPTLVGLVVLALFMGIGLFTLEPIIDMLYPPLPPCLPAIEGSNPTPDIPCYSGGGMLDLGQNFDKYIAGLFILYFASICVAGFVAGLYVYLSRVRTEADDTAIYVWQSLISSSIVGAAIPLFFSIASNKPSSFSNIILAFVISVPATVMGFIGYQLYSYRQEFVSTPKKLIANFGISSLIGIVTFVVLRVLFDSIVNTDCPAVFKTQGLFVDVCTEGKVAFGIILFIATSTTGWWMARSSKYLKFSVINGLVVGIFGPLLGSYLDNRTTLAAFYFFYGMLGGLFSLCGGVGRHWIKLFWSNNLSNWRIKD